MGTGSRACRLRETKTRAAVESKHEIRIYSTPVRDTLEGYIVQAINANEMLHYFRGSRAEQSLPLSLFLSLLVSLF